MLFFLLFFLQLTKKTVYFSAGRFRFCCGRHFFDVVVVVVVVDDGDVVVVVVVVDLKWTL